MRSESENKAIGYTRVSTQEQTRSGLSLELQDREIRKYSKRKRLELVEVITDAGISGKSMKRKGIRRLIDLCSSGEIKHVVVYRIDRLTRDILDLLNMVEDVFKKNGIKFHSITEQIDTTTPTGKFYMAIRGAFAQFERDITSERISDALRQKVVRGEPIGSPPFGYESGEGVHFEKIEDEISIIKYIKGLRRTGMSMEAIAKTLNDQGEPTKRGGKWRSGTISYMLRNCHYKKLSSQSH